MHLSILHLQFSNEFFLICFIVHRLSTSIGSSIGYKPLVLLFSPHEQYGGLEKNPESEQMGADPGNDMTIADTYKLLNIRKGSSLDVASFLDFRISQISNINPKYK